MSDSEEREEKYPPCKVVLIGGSDVGKVSIINRFINNKFTSDSKQTTIGGSFSTKNIEIENKIIKFECWDRAGQEKFRDLAKMFYKNASVFILVYDITKKSSFNELKNLWAKI